MSMIYDTAAKELAQQNGVSDDRLPDIAAALGSFMDQFAEAYDLHRNDPDAVDALLQPPIQELREILTEAQSAH